MSGIPQPSTPLAGHCSAINSNTLFVYSAGTFQSLPLAESATWTTLQSGVNVTDPACVAVVPNGDQSKAALYVVGGVAQDQNYPGLQKYTFSTQKWETLTPPTFDLRGRTDHSVAYLQSDNKILVYAGSVPQSRSTLSSQTFAVDLTGTSIRAFTSWAPPANQPILLSFGNNGAILVGAATRNKELWTFNMDQGWTKFQTNLVDPIQPQVRGVIVAGADGSKVLTTYDMTTSPNIVNQVVLIGLDGKPAPDGQVPGVVGAVPAMMKRDLTLRTWPVYNTANSPTIIRQDYGVAQDQSGTTVVSGGSVDSPINIFNNTRNAWVDNGQFFTGKADGNVVSGTNPQAPSTTSSALPDTTTQSANPTLPIPSATVSASPVLVDSSDNSRARTLKILGITLGTLSGIAAIVIIALLLLRYRRQKRRRQASMLNEKNSRMSFQDRGTSFMKEARTEAQPKPPTSRFTQMNTSNSFAFFGGKFGGKNKPQSFLPPQGPRASSESQRKLVPRKNDIRGPVELDRWGRDKEAFFGQGSPPLTPGPPQIPASTINGDAFVNQRASGWSRAFGVSDNDRADPAAYNMTTRSGYKIRENNYTGPDSRAPSQLASSVVVPPRGLAPGNDLMFDGQRISRVMVSSPTYNNSQEDLARRGSGADAARGQRAKYGQSRRRESIGSNESESSSNRTYSSDGSDYFRAPKTASTQSAWSPMSDSFERKNNGNGRLATLDGSPDPETGDFQVRAPSSAYTNSYYGNNQSRIFDQDDVRESGLLTAFPKGVESAYYGRDASAMPAALSVPKPAAKRNMPNKGLAVPEEQRPISAITTMTAFVNPGSKPAPAKEAAPAVPAIPGALRTNVKPAELSLPAPVPLEVVLSPGSDRQTVFGEPTAEVKNAQNTKIMPAAARSKAVMSMGLDSFLTAPKSPAPPMPSQMNTLDTPAADRNVARDTTITTMSAFVNPTANPKPADPIPATPAIPDALKAYVPPTKTMPNATRSNAVVSMGMNSLLLPGQANNNDTPPMPEQRTVPSPRNMPAAARSNAVLSMGVGSMLDPSRYGEMERLDERSEYSIEDWERDIIDRRAESDDDDDDERDIFAGGAGAGADDGFTRTKSPPRDLGRDEVTARAMERPETLMTAFPRGVESAYYPPKDAPGKKDDRQDMSWVNLGG